MVNRVKKRLRYVGRKEAKCFGGEVVWPRRRGERLVELTCQCCGLVVGFGPRCYFGRAWVCDVCEEQAKSEWKEKNFGGKRG